MYLYRIRVSMASRFKKDRSRIRIINWYWYVVNDKKKYYRRNVVQYIDMQQQQNKHMKNYDKDKELSYLMHLEANNLFGWAMSQKLPVSKLKWNKMLLNSKL